MIVQTPVYCAQAAVVRAASPHSNTVCCARALACSSWLGLVGGSRHAGWPTVGARSEYKHPSAHQYVMKHPQAGHAPYLRSIPLQKPYAGLAKCLRPAASASCAPASSASAARASVRGRAMPLLDLPLLLPRGGPLLRRVGPRRAVGWVGAQQQCARRCARRSRAVHGEQMRPPGYKSLYPVSTTYCGVEGPDHPESVQRPGIPVFDCVPWPACGPSTLAPLSYSN